MPRRRASTVGAEEQNDPICRHHWVIESANGPVSWGECQICHEGKELKNSIADPKRIGVDLRDMTKGPNSNSKKKGGQEENNEDDAGKEGESDP